MNVIETYLKNLFYHQIEAYLNRRTNDVVAANWANEIADALVIQISHTFLLTPKQKTKPYKQRKRSKMIYNQECDLID